MKLFDGMSKWKKRGIVFSIDLSMTLAAWYSAVWVTHTVIPQQALLLSFLFVIPIQCIVNFLCGLYRGVWRFASLPDFVRIVRAVMFGVVVLFGMYYAAGTGFPLRTGVVYSIFLVVLLSMPRIAYRWLHEYQRYMNKGKRVLVVGAGSAGEGIVRNLLRSPVSIGFSPVALVDDDPARIGREVHGIRILGPCKQIPDIARKLKIELILIAIPSAKSARMREIVSYCEMSQVAFRTLPNIKDIANGTVSFSAVREVLLEDLLGREQVMLDWDRIQASIAGKVILVTGGGGSIGSELCRQISQLSPERLIIVDNNEFNLYSIDMELRKKFPETEFCAHLCSVTDKIEISHLFDLYQPTMVFHVAAYKHVPLLESHLRVSMQNNIIGTCNVAELSHTHQVDTFVLISTDKAVNPTNIMGATKRAAEVICQNFNSISETRFITVRFGNVLDSAGSVIPLFRKQLQEGGPLTVTHEEISRYFMTIPEASQLILQASSMEEEGKIFVLDMGSPIRIRYLAEQMIKLSGKIIGKDIEIKYIGLRPGEKLHEELFHQGEAVSGTTHPKIRRARVRQFDWLFLQDRISAIESACEANDEKRLHALLCELVPEYVNQDGVSWSHSSQEAVMASEVRQCSSLARSVKLDYVTSQ